MCVCRERSCWKPGLPQCVCLTFLTQFSAYHHSSSYKNIGLHVWINFTVFHSVPEDPEVPREVKSGPKPARNHCVPQHKKKLTSWDELWGWKPILSFFFSFLRDSFLKETCYSPRFSRGEALRSDPHHRCWRRMSPLCEVWENCVCVSYSRHKARILRCLTHRRLCP